MEAPAPETGDATADSGPVVHLKQILIPVSPQDPQPVVNAKIARAQSLQAEITSCDLMDAKAKDFLSPGTGDLGRGPLAALPEPLRGVVANLEIGVLSPPVRNEAGVAVVMVCGREGSAAPVAAAPPPRPAPRSDDASREEVANRLGMQRLDLMQERYLRDLRATAFIDKRI